MKEQSTVDFDSMILDVIACKWTKHLLSAIDSGINRPGAIQRKIDHLSTKVMNESLTRLLRYNMVVKKDYEEVPLKVEYAITEIGKDALLILKLAEKLKVKIEEGIAEE